MLTWPDLSLGDNKIKLHQLEQHLPLVLVLTVCWAFANRSYITDFYFQCELMWNMSLLLDPWYWTNACPYTFPHSLMQHIPEHKSTTHTDTNTLERWAALAKPWSHSMSQVSPPGSLTDTHIWLWLNCINCRPFPHCFGSASHCSGYTRRWTWGPRVHQVMDSPCIL